MLKAARSLPSSQILIGLTTSVATDACGPWASYRPTGNYWLDRPAWELCHIKALRQRDPEPSTQRHKSLGGLIGFQATSRLMVRCPLTLSNDQATSHFDHLPQGP
jgi:hypothetical protein